MPSWSVLFSAWSLLEKANAQNSSPGRFCRARRRPAQDRLACRANFIETPNASRVRSVFHDVRRFSGLIRNGFHRFNKEIALFWVLRWCGRYRERGGGEEG